MIGQQGASRPTLLAAIGQVLILAGVVLAGVVGLRLASNLLVSHAANAASTPILETTPHISLAPLGTPLRMATSPAILADAAPTALPRMISADSATGPTSAPISPISAFSPPIRISIPVIEVNARINESPLETYLDSLGQTRWRWQDPGRAVGHLAGTGLPGGSDNIVLTGHNNWMGEVFRRLPELRRGDEITLYTEQAEHHYRVTERWIVPYRRDPVRGAARLRSYTRSADSERLTLISCYPYLTNADRIVIIAEPVAEPASSGQTPMGETQ